MRKIWCRLFHINRYWEISYSITNRIFFFDCLACKTQRVISCYQQRIQGFKEFK